MRVGRRATRDEVYPGHEHTFVAGTERRVSVVTNRGAGTRLERDPGAPHPPPAHFRDLRGITAGLDNVTLSVATARRGWATAADILNTRSLEALLSGE